MSVQEQLQGFDFTMLTTACVSLGKTLGITIKTTAVKKVNLVKQFFTLLLGVTEEQEKNLEAIVFDAEEAIRKTIGATTIRQALQMIESLETPPVVEAPAPIEQASTPPVVEAAPVIETPPVVEAAPVEQAAAPPKKIKKDVAKQPEPPAAVKVPKARSGGKVLDITKFVWSNLTLTIDQVSQAMKDAGMVFSEATLGFEYRAVHRSYSVLKEYFGFKMN